MEDIGITAQDFGVWTEPSTRQNATPPATTRPPLKRTHSLEIPDPKNEKNAVPIDSSASVGGLTEDQNDGLPEVVAKGDGELDELIAVSLHPSTSKTLSIPDATQDIISASSQDHKRRISRKEQIQDLRNTIAHLSQRLRGLRTASSPSSCVDQQAPILTRPQSLWERVAIQQFKLIHEAEEENVRLKDMLASQKSTARNIQRLIRRREDDELLLDLRNAKQPKLDNNEEVFEKLLRDIEEIYTSMNRLYDEADMNSVSCSERKQRIIPDAADDSAFVELKDKNTVPFDFKRVERAVWKYLQSSKVRGGERVCSEESKQSQDTSMGCVGFTCPEKGVASYVLEQRVSRRYVEENRIVFVSRTITDPTIDEPWFSSMRFIETMTIIVKNGPPLASGQKTSIIESHLLIYTYADIDGNEPVVVERHWPTYVDWATNVWGRKVAFNHQEIENLLFEGN